MYNIFFGHEQSQKQTKGYIFLQPNTANTKTTDHPLSASRLTFSVKSAASKHLAPPITIHLVKEGAKCSMQIGI